MIDPKLAILASLALVSLTLAGCMAGDDGASFTVPDDAGPVARQAEVDDPHQLVVTVTQETDQGRTLPGVAVVFFADQAQASGDGEVNVDAGTEAGRGQARTETSVEVSGDGSDGYTTLATGRTAGNGTVTGLLSPNTTVNVLVGDATGFTREVRFDIPLGEPGGRTTVTVPLFHDQLNIEINSTMETQVSTSEATMGRTERGSDPVEVPFSGNPDAQAGYLERVARMHTTLTWTNEPPTHADLFVGWGTPDEVLLTGEDTRQTPGEGEVSEQLTVEESTIEEHRDALTSAGPVTLYALTDDVAASPPDGVAYQMNGTATFQGTGHAYEIL